MLPPSEQAPESATGLTPKTVVQAAQAMVATAHPLATDAGYRILQQGGSAVDAAIAVQLVLSLTEPQSSGLGGGAFLLFYDGSEVVALDGRETAPAAATPERFLDAQGRPLPFRAAAVGGRSVGVPGVMHMLGLAHQRYGALPWATLFQPALQLAYEGFPLSRRLHLLLAGDAYLGQSATARDYFYTTHGMPKAIGTVLRNPDYARTLEALATHGAEALYHGPLAENIVRAVRQHPTNPGDLTLADFATYRSLQRVPLRHTYGAWTLYGMPPPSAGGIATLQILSLLEPLALRQYAPLGLDSVHLFADAGRLAYADRGRYIADPAYVPVPVDGLLDAQYLAARRRLIRLTQSMGLAAPGMPPGASQRPFGDDHSFEYPSTSHVSIVDAQGRAVSMTTSIEAAFGSRIMVNGYLLNNQLTDFTFLPTEQGRPVANRLQPGKRPRSAMAPTLVFDAQGAFAASVGSPGGSAIINYVAQTLLALLEWQLNPQQAVNLPHYGSRNGPTELELGQGLEVLVSSLNARGHHIRLIESNSGLTAIQQTPHGYLGGADPRREGTVRGY